MDDYTEAERAKFEAALRTTYPRWNLERDQDGSYVDDGPDFAWRGWQLARTTLASTPAAGGKPSPVDAATQSLIDAARAVVARWHTPRPWTEVEHTAALIARLDEAVTRAAWAGPRAGFLDTENPQCDKGGPACEGCLMIGYCLGGEAAGAAQPAQQWVPIADAPASCEVLVYMPEEKTQFQVMRKRPNVTIIGNVFAFDLTKPTHYMPLPAAPQHQGGGNAL